MARRGPSQKCSSAAAGRGANERMRRARAASGRRDRNAAELPGDRRSRRSRIARGIEAVQQLAFARPRDREVGELDVAVAANRVAARSRSRPRARRLVRRQRGEQLVDRAPRTRRQAPFEAALRGAAERIERACRAGPCRCASTFSAGTARARGAACAARRGAGFGFASAGGAMWNSSRGQSPSNCSASCLRERRRRCRGARPRTRPCTPSACAAARDRARQRQRRVGAERRFSRARTCGDERR